MLPHGLEGAGWERPNGVGMSCVRGKDPGEGEGLRMLSSEVISSESGMSYCGCPSGLFLSRGREVLFFCAQYVYNSISLLTDASLHTLLSSSIWFLL